MTDHNNTNKRNENEHRINIDAILTTQPELGPTIPDGGYGWIVLIATLFFQILIPSLSVSFGIFLAFIKLEKLTPIDTERNLRLWDDELVYMPLFFVAFWTFFEPLAKKLILTSTWPRLVGTAGNCLTCAGLLFGWLAMTGSDRSAISTITGGHLTTASNQIALFVVAGMLAGMGASIQMTQCAVLLSQYFRNKLPIVNQLGQIACALGFILTPLVLGPHIINNSLLHVTIWYQTIILQGLIANIAFRKPFYLKRQPPFYRTLSSASANPTTSNNINDDDEDDIFSRELQIKRRNQEDKIVEMIQLSEDYQGAAASISTPPPTPTDQSMSKTKDINKWITFDDDFENNRSSSLSKKLVLQMSFDDPSSSSLPIINNDTINYNGKDDLLVTPKPLFSDVPSVVNNNNTYAYDDNDDDIIINNDNDDDIIQYHQVVAANTDNNINSAVFLPNNLNNNIRSGTNSNVALTLLYLLKQPTFYKSLLMLITTKYSLFMFYTLFPSYIYVEIDDINIRRMTTYMGCLSGILLVFAPFTYCINRMTRQRRALCLWLFCWLGALGYFFLSDYYTNIYMLMISAGQIMLSITCLEHVASPLYYSNNYGLFLSAKRMAGSSKHSHSLISFLSSIALLLFIFVNFRYQDGFRLMAVLHFLTGSIWLSNYIYKKIKHII